MAQIATSSRRTKEGFLRSTALSLAATEADECTKQAMALLFLHRTEADVARFATSRRSHDESRQREGSRAAGDDREFDLAAGDDPLAGVPDRRAADTQIFGRRGYGSLVDPRHANLRGYLQGPSTVLSALDLFDVIGVAEGDFLPGSVEDDRVEAVEPFLSAADNLDGCTRLQRSMPFLDANPEAARSAQEKGADADIEITVGYRDFGTCRNRVT